jgi:hypothetical protein
LWSAFTTANTWPDFIRGDQRFERGNGAGRSPRRGFPDMGRHENWHYINLPYDPENVAGPLEDQVHAVSKIRDFMNVLASRGPASDQAYALPWLLHLIGDLHQPLHAATRFKRSTNGKTIHDRGGGDTHVKGSRNLHSYWDGLLGLANTETFVRESSRRIALAHPAPATVEIDPKEWADESHALAVSHAYTFPEWGTDARPVPLSDEYRVRARKAAMRQAATAGYRMAAVLNHLLR